MSEGPPPRSANPRRSVARNTSYIDFTKDSDEEDVDMASDDVQVVSTQGKNKRKRADSSESDDNAATAPTSASPAAAGSDDSDLGEEEYEIESIIKSRWRKTRGKRILEFLIHWKGYDSSEDSWTTAEQFDDDDPPVMEFYTKNPNAAKRDSMIMVLAKASAKSKDSAAVQRVLSDSEDGDDGDDDEPILMDRRLNDSKSNSKSKKSDDTPKKSEKEKQSSSPVKSSPVETKKRSLLSYFGFNQKKGKENEQERSTPIKSKSRDEGEKQRAEKEKEKSQNERKEKLEQLAKKREAEAKAKAQAKPKRRRADSDESDFVLDEKSAQESEDSEDEGDKSEEEEDAAKSDNLESVDDDEDIVEEKPKKAPKSAAAAKAKPYVKKAAPNLSDFRSGVKPLGQKLEIKQAIKNMSEDLPPMHDIETMFDHLVSRVPDVTKLVDQLNGRKLRVATMCSGTESPLLALNMIAKAMKAQHGATLAFDHVFSCEIEPFKQAYIERNFAPPILFRDVTELGRKKAHTAYGSLVPVPGNVDILIAGTSCVDYSNLNNQQQGIDAGGESGRTFRGMLQWVKKHQPPIVILENVCNAPWDKVVEYFAEIDYDAQHCRLDTKEFYIPHTRTRVYLFATPSKTSTKSNLAHKWEKAVKDMRRPWSSPFEAFLLHTDDQHIHRARLDLASAKEQKDGNQRKPTDWNRCESRHQRARQEEQLGILRPLTSWQEAGVCKGLDWTWNDWLLSQTERVLDLLEISTLRMAKDGIDSGFKACIWNVSQNVDRQTGSGRTALAPCLTPNMIPWVTNRGGPVTGREALALQGIPVRELLLTSENEDQLADLAGNAMTTTVVGASMLAALGVAMNKLTPGEDAEADAAKIVQEAADEDEDVASRIIGEDSLESHELDLAKVATADLGEILDLAERSSRHCQCEGQSGTASPIEECTACGYRACKSCGGRPDHHYQPCKNVRVPPTEFEKRFKELLPMRVKIAGLSLDCLDTLRKEAKKIGKGTVEEEDWKLWTKAVLGGTSDAEFRFRYLKRGYTWTAVYEAPTATLDLFLSSESPEWRLTIKAPLDEPVNSRLRSLLLHPVARLRFDVKGQDVLCGPWELCVPSRQNFHITIKGTGELVPSWHASLGLQGEYGESKRWSQLTVTVPPEATQALDRDLSGAYDLLPKCGQAMTSLHKQIATDNEKGQPALYFFLDPTRCGEADDDSYVFSTTTERLDFGTERAVIATLHSKWRESAKAEEKVRLDIRGGWVECPSAHLTAVGGADIAVVDSSASTSVKRDSATYAVPRKAKDVASALGKKGCAHATALLSCSVPLDASHSEAMWREGAWGEIDLLHQGNTVFANLAWITERLPSLDGLADWNVLDELQAQEEGSCERCAPRAPKIHWIKREGKKNKIGNKTKATIVAFEDKLEAGRYEHALKNRPTPFVVQLRLDEGRGKFRIGLNIVSLAHRALSRLPLTESKGQIKLLWRLTPGQVADVPRPPRVFVMPSNKRDPSHTQPKGFLLDLRKEQLRSLWWMLEQERATGKSHTFVEEEISEAALPSLGWRAEGKAERPVMVRGGVIADQVGYGKTIISLALIAETKGLPAPTPAPSGLIDLKATLIVVPGHLSKQWPSEIQRFTGKMFKLIIVQNHNDLKQHSISDLAKADIIVMASEVFEADSYWSRFEYLSGQPEDWLNDKQGGRFFSDRLDTAITSLATQVELLQTEGAESVKKNMKEMQKKMVEDAEGKREAHKTADFGKRMKGQAYRDKWDADEPAKKKKKNNDGAAEVENWEADEDSDDDAIPTEAVPMPTFHKLGSGKESYKSETVEGDYKMLRYALPHMFRFRRVIADEFTYLDKRTLASILRLQSSYKWVLSGTPPVGDFAAIRSIAAFMGIHLGVEDDGEGTLQYQKARAKEQTAAERFHAFREVHSAAWHSRRDDLAQSFLDCFVRQNIAEIDDIPTVEHIHPIQLPAAECAVYLELEHHLQALEMQARRETKLKDVTQGDRNARLEQALADSKTAEEALLKRCCHFTLDLSDKKRDAKSAQEACEHIAGARSAQLEGCEKDLFASINIAVGLNAHIKRKGGFAKNDDNDRHHFKDWVEHSFDLSKHQGDIEAAKRLIKVLEKCGFQSKVIPDSPIDGKSPKIEKGGKVEDVKWQLREQTHLLRKLSKELVARVRSLRFFEVVRKIQKGDVESVETLEASECTHRPSTHPNVEMAVLSCCGHVACYECMTLSATNQVCVATGKCHAAVRQTNVVKVKSLGVEGELSSGRFGAKLQKLVELIHSIPSSQRILVFLQWEDLAGKVSEALTNGKIPHATLTGQVKNRANTLDRFQSEETDARVLLLKMNDASAAGSNLTTANHAIFMGPLFTPTLYNYRATETQAIGRVRRYGQSKTVHVHRLLAVDTIDMTIFETRRKEEKSKPDYVEIPREEYAGKKKKSKSAQKTEVEVEIVSPKRVKKRAAEDEYEPIEVD